MVRVQQDGNKTSYNALLSDLSIYIPSILSKQISDQDQIQDITQEVLLSIHKSRHTFAADKRFKPWLHAIINFRKTDYLRQYYSKRDNMKTHLEDKNFMSSYVTNPMGAGEYKDIEKAMNSLPEKQRMIVQKLKVEGFTAKEVANQIGMSESAVKVSLHRTLKKLHRFFDTSIKASKSSVKHR